MEHSRVNYREQWRWRSETLCGAKALHVLEHICHPLISPRPLHHYPHLHLSSWVCNITSQRYSNSKRRYKTQGRTSYRSTNLELLYALL
jgi:hypothetical protein